MLNKIKLFNMINNEETKASIKVHNDLVVSGLKFATSKILDKMAEEFSINDYDGYIVGKLMEIMIFSDNIPYLDIFEITNHYLGYYDGEYHGDKVLHDALKFKLSKDLDISKSDIMMSLLKRDIPSLHVICVYSHLKQK